ncbi:hypothetical protein PSHT_02410 [Puccinia striiformis]|uniref:Dolichol phosphate-mannose biosynthesis regulatory protein n=4 Tax=Puccinia striiformis TaxID=27350 RepID=A0A0L0UNZ5_9BASI|nr:hypothetical protein H4Q26_018304 [Puccinia striiformis f. sp. tritici PST-130]KAI9631671.1 hypothetical protein KEM48_014658 [Puccinia striiformis f. sp. tritici PST-130]KNE88822.1 hypothetical protein, variant [Puccinia striiformis f. sp. tritici PST-78]POW09892.1 hypothetical protein PSTT_06487 [Puccinia striiformis]POW21373.1 hypothetical protein PSHT_02410 [Puccinia striiformis]
MLRYSVGGGCWWEVSGQEGKEGNRETGRGPSDLIGDTRGYSGSHHITSYHISHIPQSPMGNSDKSIGLSIFFLGSAGFIYYTISAFMIVLFPITETDTGKIGHHPYFISYDLLVKIPAVGLTLFMAIIGTCISLVMIKQAIKDQKRTHSIAL